MNSYIIFCLKILCKCNYSDNRLQISTENGLEEVISIPAYTHKILSGIERDKFLDFVTRYPFKLIHYPRKIILNTNYITIQ